MTAKEFLTRKLGLQLSILNATEALTAESYFSMNELESYLEEYKTIMMSEMHAVFQREINTLHTFNKEGSCKDEVIYAIHNLHHRLMNTINESEEE